MLPKISLSICVVFCLTNVEALRNDLTEKIGNFSLELLYHTAATEPEGKNMIISPIIVWATLASVSEVASGRTKLQINNAVRILTKNKEVTRQSFKEIAACLNVNTPTVKIAKFNALFIDRKKLPIEEFQETAKMYYEVDLTAVNYADRNSADNANRIVSDNTNGQINDLVDSDSFKDASLVLTSAIYFKGQWAVPFDKANTRKQPFYDSDGKQIGVVNMMFNRNSYPISNIKILQASVVEIPYGAENRLSMIIMLPNLGVSLQTMFKNFAAITLDAFFEELRLSKETVDNEVELCVPRFKIVSDIDLANVLTNRMGISDLFDVTKVRLPHLARNFVYATKASHRAEIDVTEDGTGKTKADLRNSFASTRFEINRPFTFMVIEKETNSIVFGGFYKQPSLY